jgi:hypothetical protein
MTDSAGDYTQGGVKRTCLLDEGTITVGKSYGLGGGSQPGRTFAAEITKSMVVAISTDTGNTFDATDGAILVNQIKDSTDLIWGIVVSEPAMRDMEVKPKLTTDADSLAKRLTGNYFRKATVWFPNVTSITEATVNCADAVAVTPGGAKQLIFDVSACNADGGLYFNDIAGAAGSPNVTSLHYVAKAADTTKKIMVAMLGGTTSAQT